MPFWGWVAAIYAIVHHTHRRMPARQVPEGDPMDISAPLPTRLKKEQDLMTAREIEAEREGATSRPARR